MKSLALPKLGPAINQVVQLLDKPRLIQIDGPETSGKSTLLYRVERSLADTERVPIRISTPLRAPDSGPTALAQIVDGLRRTGRFDDERSKQLESERTWRGQLGLVESWLVEIGEPLILLMDEPSLWPVDAGADPYFGECTSDVLRLLGRVPGCTVVIAGTVPFDRAVDERLDLSLCSSEPIIWLQHASSWGSLAGAARTLAEVGANTLQSFSPLEIRLLVAHYRLNEVLEETWSVPDDRTRRALSLELARRLQRPNTISAQVRHAWAFLARVRSRFSKSLLDLALGADTSPEAADLVEYGLLFQEDEHWVLHEMLREDALSRSSWVTEAERSEIHIRIARHYANTLEPDREDLLERSVEAFYHAAESGDPDLVHHCRAHFVPQLNAAGRTLSLSGAYEAAANLFETALDWDDNSDYAHHYLAYNLDCQARQPTRVAEHYKIAISLRPTHPWWHSRWISFLVARGLTADARKAWDRALDCLYPMMSSSTGVYLELHRWVAAILLHRSELEFAHEVLDGIPGWVLSQEPSLDALKRYLQALAEVAETGAFVPADRLLQSEPWWRAGPFLLPESLKEGYRLTHWFAGRVESVEEGDVEFRAARVVFATHHVQDIVRITAESDVLASWKWEGLEEELATGAFVEIGTFRNAKGNVQNRLGVHRTVPWQQLNLPTLHPDPNRYILAQGHAD